MKRWYSLLLGCSLITGLSALHENPYTVTSQADLTKTLDSHHYSFIKFTAPWCSACKSPIYAELASEYPELNFLVVDISKGDGGKIAKAHKVAGFPTFLIFEDDKEIGRIVGDYAKLKKQVADYAEKNKTSKKKEVKPIPAKADDKLVGKAAPKPEPKKAIEPKREKSTTVSVTSDSDLNKHIKGDKPVVVKFYADWCGACKMIQPFFEDMAEEYHNDVTFVEVNADKAKELVEKHNIEGFPTFISFHKNKKMETIVGANKNRLKSHVKELQEKGKKVSKKRPAAKEAAPSEPAPKKGTYVPPKTKKPVVVRNRSELKEYTSQDKPTFVKFYADWCGPCKMMAPIFESVAEEFGNDGYFVAVNIDDSRDLAQEHRVYSIPHIKVFKGGKEVDQITGVNADMVKNAIKKYTK